MCGVRWQANVEACPLVRLAIGACKGKNKAPQQRGSTKQQSYVTSNIAACFPLLATTQVIGSLGNGNLTSATAMYQIVSRNMRQSGEHVGEAGKS